MCFGPFLAGDRFLADRFFAAACFVESADALLVPPADCFAVGLGLVEFGAVLDELLFGELFAETGFVVAPGTVASFDRCASRSSNR